MRLVHRVAAAALAGVLFSSLALASTARVRVIHASPDAPSVDVVVNDSVRAFTDVAFNEATDYAALPGGVYNVKVVPSGAASPVVIDADLNLLYYRSYTVVAVGRLSGIEALVLDDTADPVPSALAPGSARLRFVHASPDAPAVDVKVVDGPFLFRNVPFKGTGEGVLVPGGKVDLEVRVAGTDTVALTLPGIALRGGTAYTAVATGLVSGTPALGAVLAEDGRSTPVFIRPGRAVGKR